MKLNRIEWTSATLTVTRREGPEGATEIEVRKLGEGAIVLNPTEARDLELALEATLGVALT